MLPKASCIGRESIKMNVVSLWLLLYLVWWAASSCLLLDVPRRVSENENKAVYSIRRIHDNISWKRVDSSSDAVQKAFWRKFQRRDGPTNGPTDRPQLIKKMLRIEWYVSFWSKLHDTQGNCFSLEDFLFNRKSTHFLGLNRCTLVGRRSVRGHRAYKWHLPYCLISCYMSNHIQY